MTRALVEKLDAQLKTLPAAIGAAMLAVDRARFVRDCDRAFAYEDWPLPLDTPSGATVPPVAELLQRHGTWGDVITAGGIAGVGATISAPHIYPYAFAHLGLAPGHRHLELGCGTGYGAALAAHIVGEGGRVTSVDVDPHLVAAGRERCAEWSNVTLVHADGRECAALVGGHDHVWMTFSVTEPPRALIDALPEGAALLAPIGAPPPTVQRWMRWQRRDGALVEQDVAPVMFISARALVPA
jgi:protein-L-isoaspartate(D-aspartate) O-methyltransferase